MARCCERSQTSRPNQSHFDLLPTSQWVCLVKIIQMSYTRLPVVHITLRQQLDVILIMYSVKNLTQKWWSFIVKLLYTRLKLLQYIMLHICACPTMPHPRRSSSSFVPSCLFVQLLCWFLQFVFSFCTAIYVNELHYRMSLIKNEKCNINRFL